MRSNGRDEISHRGAENSADPVQQVDGNGLPSTLDVCDGSAGETNRLPQLSLGDARRFTRSSYVSSEDLIKRPFRGRHGVECDTETA